MPIVSVTMASYNHGRFISEAIESVLDQTLTDLELIIVDDGSSDDSRDIIRKYSKQDPRVRYIFHESNMGISRTKNDGIQASKGKYIALIDSDDMWARDKLKKQADILSRNENLVVWTEGEIVDADSRPTRQSFSWFVGSEKKKKSGDIFDELLRENIVLFSSMMLKKDNLKNIRFNKDLKYMNDYEFNLCLASRYSFFFIDEPLTKYRVHGNNSIFKENRVWDEDRRRIYEAILDRFRDRISKKAESRLLCNNCLIYSRMGRPGAALACLGRAVKAYPPNAYYLFLLGYSIVKKACLIDPYRVIISARRA